MDKTTLFAIWALCYAAITTILQNTIGAEFVDDWYIVILVVWTVPFLWWLNRPKSGAS